MKNASPKISSSEATRKTPSKVNRSKRATASTNSYVKRHSRVLSYLQDLEEKEFDMMVTTTIKVGSYTKK